MFGSHLSVAGGLHHALVEARQLKMDCVQVFTKNQRQWTAPPLTDEQVQTWRDHQKQTGITDVVSHDSYLINLASPAGPTRSRSIALFRDELERCERLGIAHLVAHPGSHVNAGGERAGLKRIASALDRVHADLPALNVVTCLELTAGQGTGLGHRFEHLRCIIDTVKQPDRLAVCLDTAHVLAAGYDLTSAAGMKAVLEELDDVLGLDLVTVVHINDSKTPRGSRVDRHEHIGLGHVATDAFRVLANHPRFKSVPKILETAKGDAPNGRPWDAVNLAKLRRMVRKTAARKRKGTRTMKGG